MNNFHIEPGTPEHCTVDGGLARDLGDAIQAAFPLETEDAQLVWHSISVPLSYKYDFSVIIEDIIDMLAMCHERQTGSLQVSFGSDTFNADWTLKLGGDSIVITAQWNSVAGNYEARLNERPSVLVRRDEFFEQWLGVLRRAVEGVEAAGIRLTDDSLLSRARRLLQAGFSPG